MGGDVPLCARRRGDTPEVTPPRHPERPRGSPPTPGPITSSSVPWRVLKAPGRWDWREAGQGQDKRHGTRQPCGVGATTRGVPSQGPHSRAASPGPNCSLLVAIRESTGWHRHIPTLRWHRHVPTLRWHRHVPTLRWPRDRVPSIPPRQSHHPSPRPHSVTPHRVSPIPAASPARIRPSPATAPPVSPSPSPPPPPGPAGPPTPAFPSPDPSRSCRGGAGVAAGVTAPIPVPAAVPVSPSPPPPPGPAFLQPPQPRRVPSPDPARIQPSPSVALPVPVSVSLSPSPSPPPGPAPTAPPARIRPAPATALPVSPSPRPAPQRGRCRCRCRCHTYLVRAQGAPGLIAAGRAEHPRRHRGLKSGTRRGGQRAGPPPEGAEPGRAGPIAAGGGRGPPPAGAAGAARPHLPAAAENPRPLRAARRRDRRRRLRGGARALRVFLSPNAGILVKSCSSVAVTTLPQFPSRDVFLCCDRDAGSGRGRLGCGDNAEGLPLRGAGTRHRPRGHHCGSSVPNPPGDSRGGEFGDMSDMSLVRRRLMKAVPGELPHSSGLQLINEAAATAAGASARGTGTGTGGRTDGRTDRRIRGWGEAEAVPVLAELPGLPGARRSAGLDGSREPPPEPLPAQPGPGGGSAAFLDSEEGDEAEDPGAGALLPGSTELEALEGSGSPGFSRFRSTGGFGVTGILPAKLDGGRRGGRRKKRKAEPVTRVLLRRVSPRVCVQACDMSVTCVCGRQRVPSRGRALGRRGDGDGNGNRDGDRDGDEDEEGAVVSQLSPGLFLPVTELRRPRCGLRDSPGTGSSAGLRSRGLRRSPPVPPAELPRGGPRVPRAPPSPGKGAGIPPLPRTRGERYRGPEPGARRLQGGEHGGRWAAGLGDTEGWRGGHGAALPESPRCRGRYRTPGAERRLRLFLRRAVSAGRPRCP
ncbi:collagen alpha-1(VII) chain-like [Haemorhous mexicanus]|uniref:collagen alpha-1(VII) chain-like n=1 Tax=Haemorhous mexicanus TaxID=30427 RepID=UPI0028BEE538|nr:collagen alpha-1(VII) chain-like [Haemorhous mexicanus]